MFLSLFDKMNVILRPENDLPKMKRFLSILLTSLFMCYMACTMLCTHSHIVDGRVVTHTHPYSQEGHQHSGASFSAFGSVHLSPFEGKQQTGISNAMYLLYEIRANANDTRTASLHIAPQTLRAPPTC